MPPLIAFGRKWKLGADDFFLAASIDSTVKIVWLLAAIVVYIFNKPLFDSCQNEWHINMYFCGLVVAIATTLLIDVAVVKHSTQGGMMDLDARKLITPLVYLRLTWEVLDIGVNIVGSVLVFGDSFNCLEEASPFTYKFLRRFVICNWISAVIILLLLKYFHDPNGKLNPTKFSEIHQCTNKYDVGITKSSAIIEKRWRQYFCFWPKSKDSTASDGFHEVGRLLAFLFHQDEFVSTDIVAGLIAIFVKEKQKRYLETGVMLAGDAKPVITKPPTKEDRDDEKNNLKFENPESEVYLLRQFFNYVHGVSGWKGFMLDKFKQNPIGQLWKSSTCFGCFRKPYQVDIEDDNCCFCNTSALRQSLPILNEEDLLYVSFKCDYFQVPFFVALDHCTKSIVVTLRGSYGMEDIIADLSAVPTEFKIEGSSETFLAHHGMLLVAQKVKEKLDSLNILANTKQKYPSYKLVLVGQSLGGGSAAILGMILHAQFDDLKVYTFNTPGCALSLNGAEWCESFTTTVTYGHDIFGRSSITSFLELKNRIMDTIRDCSTPKYKILTSGMYSCLCGGKSRLKFYSNEPGIKDKDTNIPVDNANPIIPEAYSYNQRMYLPGKIIHITENPRWRVSSDGQDKNTHGNNNFRFQMRWANRNEFLKIIISPRMQIDHSHFRMVKAFEEYL